MVPGTVQYAPFTRGTNLWDLLHDYEANALIKSETWNRVKLVISENQMQCYLNGDMVLWIPELLGKNMPGALSIQGQGRYANLQVSPNEVADLPHQAGADLTKHDVRYLRDWEYTGEAAFPDSVSFRSCLLYTSPSPRDS